jgi:hypothetical protein
MSMKREWLLISCALLAVLITGCAGVSSKPVDYVGEYVFMPKNMPTGESASFVILKNDRTALEVHFSSETDKVLTAQTTWYLHRGTNEEVVIGNRAYPIQHTRAGIRLFIDTLYVDGESRYYEKFR